MGQRGINNKSSAITECVWVLEVDTDESSLKITWFHFGIWCHQLHISENLSALYYSEQRGALWYWYKAAL